MSDTKLTALTQLADAEYADNNLLYIVDADVPAASYKTTLAKLRTEYLDSHYQQLITGGTEDAIATYDAAGCLQEAGLTLLGTTVGWSTGNATFKHNVATNDSVVDIKGNGTGYRGQLALYFNAFSGTITPADLTANRTYTLPDSSGTFSIAPATGFVEGASNLTTQYAIPYVSAAGTLMQSSSIVTDATGNLSVGGNITFTGNNLNTADYVVIAPSTANANADIRIQGNGTGFGYLRLYDQDNAELIQLYCQSGDGNIQLTGTAPTTLNFITGGTAPVIMKPGGSEVARFSTNALLVNTATALTTGDKLSVDGPATFAGDVITSGGIGVGANPVTGVALTIKSAGAIQFNNADTDGFKIQQYNTNSWTFTALSANSNLAIQNSALLVNTTTALTTGDKLSVNGQATFGGKIITSDAAIAAIDFNIGAIQRAIISYTNADSILDIDSDGLITFSPNNTEAVRVTTAGALLVGTATALTTGDKLSVNGPATFAGNVLVTGTTTSRINNHGFDTQQITINKYGTGNRTSFIDFLAQDAAGLFDARIIRNSGANGTLLFEHRGTGVVAFNGLTDNSRYTFNSSGIDIDFQVKGDTDDNLIYVNAGTDSVGIGTATALTTGDKLSVNGPATFGGDTVTVADTMRIANNPTTGERGIQMRLTNKTGAASVKGMVIEQSSTTDSAFQAIGADEPDPTGVVAEAGIADGSECWVWMPQSLCQVLLEDSTAATRGYWVKVSDDDDGRADATNAAPPGGTINAIEDHFTEIGHAAESKTAGTDVLCLIHLHFN